MLKKKIISYRPSHIKKFGIGYVMTRLAVEMNNDYFEADAFSITSEFSGENHHIHVFLNTFFYRLLSKLFSEQSIKKLSHKLLIKKAKAYDIIYLWPGSPLGVFNKIKQQGKLIAVDAVNSHERTAKNILDEESKRLGGLLVHSITESKVDDEIKKLSLADFVFSPSPEVTLSLIENSVSQNKIIETSYGLEESQLVKIEEINNKKTSVFTVLFVGSVIVRKGIHLLLDYWLEAGIKGRLQVIGKIDASIEALINSYKEVASIEFISFTDNLDQYYMSADLFILPSLEEGSPLVTYMAVGAGLPCIVSPMGAGGVIRDGVEGYVIPPHEKGKWINSLRLLSQDAELRKKMAYAARRRAESYIWPLVAKQRTEALMEKIGKKII